MKTYTGRIERRSHIPANGIYQFGANTQGRHGLGAARIANLQFDAIYGIASGPQGRAYGIVTKNLSSRNHPSIAPETIINQIRFFYIYAEKTPLNDFYVAYSGHGSHLSGFTTDELASYYAIAGDIPDNIVFEEGFAELVKKHIQLHTEHTKI